MPSTHGLEEGPQAPRAHSLPQDPGALSLLHGSQSNQAISQGFPSF